MIRLIDAEKAKQAIRNWFDETEVEVAIMVDGEAYCEDCLEDARTTANTIIETLLKSLSPLEKAGLARFGGVDWGDLYTEYIEEYE